MKKFYLPVLVLLLLTLQLSAQEDLKIWLKNPAPVWDEALPVGNGKLGAMVFGGIEQERLQLNEESVWCKQGEYLNKEGGHLYIDEIRELLFEGKYLEAQKMAHERLMVDRLRSGTNSYQTLGDLHISFGIIDNARDYRRELDLDRAVAQTKFSAEGVKHYRTVFSSHPDEVLVMMIGSDKDGQVSAKLELDRPGEGEQVSVEDNTITMKQHVANGQGVRYETRLVILNHGGSLSRSGTGVKVEGADKLELRLVAATDYNGDDPAEICEDRLDKLSDRSYNDILNDHITDYQALFKRVTLDLPDTDALYFATDERLDAQKRGVIDPSLAELYFQFGRYLLISSSRSGDMPANLQGIWADGLIPPWNADYHININTQMNYWPSEVTNLSECHEPFLSFIGKLRENGRETAKEIYGTEGFTAHHTTDAWHATAAFGFPKYGMWPMGAAWASTHMWEHYLFTGDIDFLKDYGYKVMREAALFLSDFLTEDPNTGYLVSGPSMSPENTYLTPDGDEGSVCMGPAMDHQIIWHLFNSVISASELLDTDKQFRRKLKSQLEQLAPVKIGEDGRILEWSDERLREAEPGHRHMSHLYGLFPSKQYNWKDSPEYMKASASVIEERLRHGGGHTGWSRAWMINFYARLRDSEAAMNSLNLLWAKSTKANMLDNHPPFQIDGNFGGTAGIAEMLLQSHAGEIHLLPCLPEQWHSGKVSGLVARGGFEIDIKWTNGKIDIARIKSRLGNKCVIRYKDELIELITETGEEYLLDF